jgi:hypothetical protein
MPVHAIVALRCSCSPLLPHLDQRQSRLVTLFLLQDSHFYESGLSMVIPSCSLATLAASFNLIQPDTSCKLIAEKSLQHTLIKILSHLSPGLQRVSLEEWYSRSTWPSCALSPDAQVDVSFWRTGQAHGQTHRRANTILWW